MIKKVSIPESYREFVKSVFADNGDILNYLHCYFGIVGEFEEYMIADTELNIKEELGDLLYYTTMLSNMTDGPYEFTLTDDEPDDSLYHAPHILCDILDIVKKVFFYKTKQPDELKQTTIKAMKMLVFLLNCEQHHSFTDIMQNNIDKLTKRYPSLKFTPEDSEKRADKHV